MSVVELANRVNECRIVIDLQKVSFVLVLLFFYSLRCFVLFWGIRLCGSPAREIHICDFYRPIRLISGVALLIQKVGRAGLSYGARDIRSL